MKQEWFESWFDSKYYPILYKNRNEQEAASFVDALMTYLNIPPQSVVADVACGEGRYAFQLSKYAELVLGFDLSKERIAKAKEQFERDGINFYEHDMRMPMHVNYFDYIFNFFTSFGYFDSYRDHLQAAKSLSNALKPNGYLVIDYFNNIMVKKQLVPKETKLIDGFNFEIEKFVADGKIVKSILVNDGLDSKQYYEKVSDVSKQEFEQLFEQVGLQLQEVFGDYHLSAFDENTSPRLIMVFKKK